MNHPFSLVPGHRILSEGGRAVARHGRYTLASAFQPVVSPALMRAVGVEALLRVSDERGEHCTQAFLERLDTLDLVDTCRVARALHVLNAPTLPNGNEWLFLNLAPESIRLRKLDAQTVAQELSALDLPPARIVFEIVERAGLDDGELRAFVEEYRAAGFRIAIDDFGAGASNYDRVLGIQPDIIKLDRSLIANASASTRARRLFPHIVALLREAGSLVLVEGIETEEQAQIAIDADAELLQGYFFARPEPAPAVDTFRKRLSLLMGTGTAPVRGRTDVGRFRSRFLDTWTAFRDGRPIELIAQDIAEPEITRLYVIDAKGYQVGDTALTRGATRGHTHPLSNAQGACWARRHYFQRAMEQPGRIQVTRPYLSLTEQRLCVTWSCATSHPAHGQCVVCMDVLVDG